MKETTKCTEKKIILCLHQGFGRQVCVLKKRLHKRQKERIMVDQIEEKSMAIINLLNNLCALCGEVFHRTRQK